MQDPRRRHWVEALFARPLFTMFRIQLSEPSIMRTALRWSAEQFIGEHYHEFIEVTWQLLKEFITTLWAII